MYQPYEVIFIYSYIKYIIYHAYIYQENKKKSTAKETGWNFDFKHIFH